MKTSTCMNTAHYNDVWKRLHSSLIILFVVFTFFSKGIYTANAQNSKSLVNENTLAQLVNSQGNSDSNLLSIQFTNVTLQEALELLAEEINVGFSFNPDVMPEKKVTFSLSNVPPHEVIYKLLKGTNLEPILPPSKDVIVIREKKPLPKVDTFQQSISGTVVDSQSGEALPGVNVIAGEGAGDSPSGTTTDMNGEYEIGVDDNVTSLIFSYVGYERLEVSIENRTEINIELGQDIQLLDDVVVVGYGTVQKSDLTGSVNSIRGEELAVGQQASVDQAIQGRIPGVQVTQTSAEPGGGFSIRIRGTNSITAGNEPLYVIDGLPGANPLNSLNPADIESIEVLKDASATAIYGARGSNGVILITTKQGQQGSPLEVSYNGSIGFQEAAKKLDLMSAQEYMNFYNDLHIDRGEDLPFTQQEINSIGSGTNWQNEVLRSAPIQEHHLSFSGGSEDTQYFLSTNYFNQDGIVLSTGFEKYSGRVNLVHSLNEQLEVGINLNNSVEMEDTVPLGLGVNRTAGVIATSLQLPPTMPVLNEDGSYAVSLQDLSNSVAQAETIDNFAEIRRLFGNAYINYSILENLNARVNVGYNQRSVQRDIFLNTTTQRGVLAEGQATKNLNEDKNYLFEFTTEYNQQINSNNRFTLLGGYSFQKFEDEGFNAAAQAFPTTAFRFNNLGAGDPSQYVVGSYKQENTLLSGFGRLNYNFADKYLLTATFRADGSSRFGENTKFAYFPSGALAWRISNESFFPEEGFLGNFSDLKLRASYGLSGNQEIGNGRSLVLLGTGPIAVLDGQEVQSIAPIQLANPDLKWETTASFDVGLDFGILNDRITGSIDYFVNNTRDLLLELPIPTTSGFSSSLQNVGDTRNSGLEFTISSNNLTGNFNWSTDLNFATLNNEVTNLGELPRILQGGTRFISEFTMLREGDPVNSYYGYVFDGVFQSQQDVENSPEQANAMPGGRKFKDINGDGIIGDEDRTILGDPFPDFTLGFNNNFSYKGFGLRMFIEGRFGFELANFTNIDSENPIDDLRNRQRYVLNRWTPENQTNKHPSFVNPSRTFDFNSRVVEDASFIRLKNLRLSYSFPNLNFGGISSLSVYATGQNLITITGYDGYNPDVNVLGSSNIRIDYSAYPLARIYSLGLNIRI